MEKTIDKAVLRARLYKKYIMLDNVNKKIIEEKTKIKKELTKLGIHLN